MEDETVKKRIHQGANVMKMASEVASAIPVVGDTVSMCLGVIATILSNLDASGQMPEFLRQCRSKLVHVQ